MEGSGGGGGGKEGGKGIGDEGEDEWGVGKVDFGEGILVGFEVGEDREGVDELAKEITTFSEL